MDDRLRILIVEDNLSDAELMVRRLTKEGFKIDWQSIDNEIDYRIALEKSFDLILSDWSLPEFNGLRALEITRELALDTPFIIVSGSIGDEAAVKALHQGAVDYILKDRPDRLGQAVRNALEQKKLRDDRHQKENRLRLQAAALNAAANAIMITDPLGLIEWVNPAFTDLTGYPPGEVIGKNPDELLNSGHHSPLFFKTIWDTIHAGNVWHGEMINRRKDGQIYFEEQTITPLSNSSGQISQFIFIKQDITSRKNAEKLLLKASEDLKIAYDATLQGWSNALELKEHETAGHSLRVVQLTLDLAHRLGMDPDRMIHIQRGALLHDIGKMGIPDKILLKPGPLDAEEWAVMRKHPVYAYDLLCKIPYLSPALDIPYYHHEYWDGSGYPNGIQGEAIPIAARIFAVIDVWDALSHDRPYRSAWADDKVIQYLQEQAGKQFDPKVVHEFLELIQKKNVTAQPY